MIEKIKKWNRTVLELESGIVLFGVVVQVIAMWFVPDMLKFTIGLWLGILVAMISGLHMWQSLQKAFDGFEGDASKKSARAAIVRYIAIVVIFALIIITEIGEPLAAFAGIMGLKIGAYLQPLTHKFYNKIFHESDPVPMSLEEYEELQGLKEDKER
ncbi:MAG: hypothetical protein IJW63_08970 [Lachnospiraceae bacterium]|nr:hypothetical protein [Lachnospiraceae bacterium]